MPNGLDHLHLSIQTDIAKSLSPLLCNLLVLQGTHFSPQADFKQKKQILLSVKERIINHERIKEGTNDKHY